MMLVIRFVVMIVNEEQCPMMIECTLDFEALKGRNGPEFSGEEGSDHVNMNYTSKICPLKTANIVLRIVVHTHHECILFLP